MTRSTAGSLIALAMVWLLVAGCSPGREDEPASVDATRESTGNDSRGESVASGETGGLPFELQRAEMQNDVLTLHGDEGRAFFVFLFLDEGEDAAGNRYSYSPAAMGDPHIHMHYRSDDGIEIDTFMEDYSLELEFGQPVDGRLPGSITLKLPDEPQSFVSGSFEANVSG